MALLELSLESLQKLDDGRIEAAFQHELKMILLDLQDRPGDERERSINLKIGFKPRLDDAGDCDSVQTQIQVKSAMPSRKSTTYDMKPRRMGGHPQLVFNELSLDNANQPALFDTPGSESRLIESPGAE